MVRFVVRPHTEHQVAPARFCQRRFFPTFALQKKKSVSLFTLRFFLRLLLSPSIMAVPMSNTDSSEAARRAARMTMAVDSGTVTHRQAPSRPGAPPAGAGCVLPAPPCHCPVMPC